MAVTYVTEAQALYSLVKYFNWPSFALLYEADDDAALAALRIQTISDLFPAKSFEGALVIRRLTAQSDWRDWTGARGAKSANNGNSVKGGVKSGHVGHVGRGRGAVGVSVLDEHEQGLKWNGEPDYRQVLKEILKMKEKRLIILCQWRKIPTILRQVNSYSVS